METSLVVARDLNGVIGVGSKLPWHCPADLELFKEITKGKVVVMGRKTWESLPVKPLPNRINIVITSDVSKAVGADVVVNSVERAIEAAELFKYRTDEIVFIGGKSIYDRVVGLVDYVHVSEMNFHGDYDDLSDESVVIFDYQFWGEQFNSTVISPVYDDTGKLLFKYHQYERVK